MWFKDCQIMESKKEKTQRCCPRFQLNKVVYSNVIKLDKESEKEYNLK